MNTFFIPKYIQNIENNVEEIKDFLLKYDYTYYHFDEINSILYFSNSQTTDLLNNMDYLLMCPIVQNNRLSYYDHLVLNETQFNELFQI